MLARKISNLACLRLSGVTGGLLATNVWVKMRSSARAVAVSRHGEVVKMVHYQAE